MQRPNRYGPEASRRRPRQVPRQLTVAMILAWADAHRTRTGGWPIWTSGPVAGSLSETWQRIDKALRRGYRGLPGGSSLARLLAAQRGVRNRVDLPPLTIPLILSWCDYQFAQTGEWPTQCSGAVLASPQDTWCGINFALRLGYRELPGGTTLADLLQEQRGVRNLQNLPDFTIPQILSWIDAHRQDTGLWPNGDSGSIPEAPGETWGAVDAALYKGARGLPGGSSLAKLLAEQRGVRNLHDLPPLEESRVLSWADAHYRRTGWWPTCRSGPIAEAPGETWLAVDQALRRATRGLGGGSSLARLLLRSRQVPGARRPRHAA